MNPQRRRQLQWAGAATVVASGVSTPPVLAGWFDSAPKAAELRPMRAVVWKDFLGVNAQLQWVPPEMARLQVTRLKALGLNWVRLGIHWMLAEPEEGKFNLDNIDFMMKLVKDSGLKAITGVVGTPNFASSGPAGDRYADKYPPKDPRVFAQRMVMLAQRYPQVDVWQIWNEPNIPGFWYPKADPEGYAKMLAPAVVALRAAVPGKDIAMAGMAYYSQMYGRDGLMLEAMGKLGAYGLNVIAAYHPYTPLPEGSDDGSHDFLKHVPFMHTWLRAAGVKQIWATEWGWSSYDGPKEEQAIIGEAGQADYTLRRLALMAALDYDRIFLFTLADLDARAGVRDRRYGLLRENGEPKPVYKALANFLLVCGPRLEPDAPPRIEGKAPNGLISIGWKRADGRRLWMVWADKPVNVTLSGVARGSLHQPLKGSHTELKANGANLTVPVTAALQILVLG